MIPARIRAQLYNERSFVRQCVRACAAAHEREYIYIYKWCAGYIRFWFHPTAAAMFRRDSSSPAQDTYAAAALTCRHSDRLATADKIILPDSPKTIVTHRR